MFNIKGKIALVTGSGRGIGRAVAEEFARHGASVVLTARTESQLSEVVEAIRVQGGSALAVPGDITDESFVEQLFGRVRDEFGRLDILVNNAGIALGGRVEEFSTDDFRRCLEVNVVAAFMCTQQAVRLMKATTGTGKIINIGSVRSHWTENGGAGAYNASKFALRAMTESIARQIHGTGLNIAVGMVCPGVVDTLLTNPDRKPHPDWLKPETVALAVLHAVCAPENVNVFDITLFPLSQKPW